MNSVKYGSKNCNKEQSQKAIKLELNSPINFDKADNILILTKIYDINNATK